MLQLLKLAHSTKNHPKRKFFPGRCDCEQAPALSSEEEGFPAPHIPLSIQAFKYCRSPLTGLEVRGQGRSPLGVCIPAYSPIPFSFPLIDNSLSSRNNRWKDIHEHWTLYSLEDPQLQKVKCQNCPRGILMPGTKRNNTSAYFHH